MNPGGWLAPAGSASADRCPTGIAVGVGAAATVGVAMLAATLPPSPLPRLALMVGAVAVFAAVAGDGLAALSVAGLAWPIGNGFLLNRFGVLTWHGRVDAWFVLALVTAVAVGMLVAQMRREVRGRQRLRPLVALLRGAAAQRPGTPGTSAPPAETLAATGLIPGPVPALPPGRWSGPPLARHIGWIGHVRR